MEFDWDEHNIRHIARHEVSPQEAESVLRGSSLYIDTEIRDGEERITYLGQALSGSILIVVVTPRGHKFRVVTAFRANRRNRANFLKFSGEMSERVQTGHT